MILNEKKLDVFFISEENMPNILITTTIFTFHSFTFVQTKKCVSSKLIQILLYPLSTPF